MQFSRVTIGAVFLNSIKSVFTIVCSYFPNYPSLSPYYNRTCTEACCNGLSTSIIDTCCLSTTKIVKTTTPYNAFLETALGAGFGSFILFGFCVGGIVFGINYYNKKAMAKVTNYCSPNWQDPAVQAKFVGKFPITQLPPGYTI